MEDKRFDVGDRVKVIRAATGALGTNGCTGVITTKPSTNGCGHGLRVEFDTGRVWAIGHLNEVNLELITKGGGDMKPTQRKTYKQLKESVTVKKDALWQEACDDGTQEYVLLNPDDNKDPRQTQRIYDRALVEEDPKNFVEVFAVTPAFMTQAELDQWDAFKKVMAKPAGRKTPGAKLETIKATRGRKVKKAA